MPQDRKIGYMRSKEAGKAGLGSRIFGDYPRARTLRRLRNLPLDHIHDIVEIALVKAHHFKGKEGGNHQEEQLRVHQGRDK